MPQTPLDDVEFLASSPNRVRVLEALAERAYTRPELHDSTGVTRPTLGWILDDCETRGWVTREGRTFSLTPLGRLIITSFADLLETVETTQRLREVAPFLPLADLPFDVRRFRESTITVPHPPDVSAHLRRVGELVENGSTLRWLEGNVYIEAVVRQRDLVGERDQRYEIVLGDAALDVLRSHGETAAMVRDVLATGNVTLYEFTGEVPFSLATVDDTALVLPYDDEGTPCALVETTDPEIRALVVATLDEYRGRAERVTLEELRATR
jgi:predicted transcriptional regulator